MTEPLDLDAIETEARAYVDTHSGEHLLPCGIYLQATLKIIDELRAPPGADVMELARSLNLVQLDTESDEEHLKRVARAIQQYGDERAATRDAEIARLFAQVAAE